MIERIYIAGPITGRYEDNLPAFRQAEKILRNNGYITIVPHDLFTNTDTTGWAHKDFMDICIPNLLMCDMVVVLTDWYLSKGAIQEVSEARKHNIPIVFIARFSCIYGFKSFLLKIKHWFTRNLSWFLKNGNKMKNNLPPIVFKDVDLTKYDISIDLHVHEELTSEYFTVVKYKDQQIFCSSLSHDKLLPDLEAKMAAYKFLTDMKLINI